jgi:hypothetical protein
MLDKGNLVRGAWDEQEQHGQVPDTREGQAMVTIGHSVYFFGG